MSGTDLAGRVAVVTGGNGGIGLGIAQALIDAGAAVAIWARNDDKSREAVTTLTGNGGRAIAVRCDVTSENDVREAMVRTVGELGKVDALFANAGINRKTPLLKMTFAEWREVMGINLDGSFLCAQAAARHMVERGEGGSLVGTASLGAIEGQARGQHYAATKGGLISMMKACAVELARYGIRANAVLPGWIETAMTEGAFNWDRFRDNVMPRIPVRRWGQPDDFGAVAVYLASPASAYHTGDTFLIDGGYAIF